MSLIVASVVGNIAARLPLDQINNYLFNVGANPKKLAQHGCFAVPISMVVLPVFAALGMSFGAAVGGAAGYVLSLGRPIVALSTAVIGAGLAGVYVSFSGEILSNSIARDFISDLDTNAITKEQSDSLSKIRLYEGIAMGSAIALGIFGLVASGEMDLKQFIPLNP